MYKVTQSFKRKTLKGFYKEKQQCLTQPLFHNLKGKALGIILVVDFSQNYSIFVSFLTFLSEKYFVFSQIVF